MSETWTIPPSTDATPWKRHALNAEIRKYIAGKYRLWRSEGIMGRIYAKAHYATTKKWERHILYGEPW